MTVISPALNNIVYADWYASGSSTGGIAEALATMTSGGKLVLRPNQTYTMSVEALYAINTNGPLVIEGGGWSTILSLTGASNKGLHITGTRGVTTVTLVLRNFKVISNTIGSSAGLIHLDGLSVFTVENVVFDGNNKADFNLLLTATQQGEVSGGYNARATVGMQLELATAISSNGVDIHGVSFANSGTNIKAVSLDADLMIHHNHFVTAPVHVDVAGCPSAHIEGNHFEQHTTAGVRVSSGAAHIIANGFFPGAAGTDVTITATDGTSEVMGNLIQGKVNFGAGTDIKYALNNVLASSVLTNSSTKFTAFGNEAVSGSDASNFGAVFNDDVTFTSRRTAAGDVGLFKANPAVSGAWGVTATGAGAAQDIYYRFGAAGPAVVGTTAGASGGVRVMDAVGGAQWAKFSSAGIEGRIVYRLGTAIASAATISIPADGDVFHVTGTTNITNGITVNAGDAGRIITLIFDGVLVLSDTGTSKLRMNLVTVAGMAITLRCDGTNWIEV